MIVGIIMVMMMIMMMMMMMKAVLKGDYINKAMQRVLYMHECLKKGTNITTRGMSKFIKQFQHTKRANRADTSGYFLRLAVFFESIDS